MRASTQLLAKSYVNARTKWYGILSLPSKLDPNRAPANNAWKMGSMIFQPKNAKTQKIIVSITFPGRIEQVDHHTNERYI
jgi:hypothetical protein